MEQIPFDFSGDGALDSLNRLDDILNTGHWTDRGLNPGIDMTALLLRLLQQNGIGVYKMPYEHKGTEYSEETWQRARHYAGIVRKRDDGISLLPAAELFGEAAPDYSMTANGALFFPGKKAYVRAGGIKPEKLLELLEREGSGMVLLFPAVERDAYYAFVRNMTRGELHTALEQIREDQQTALFEAVYALDEKARREKEQTTEE